MDIDPDTTLHYCQRTAPPLVLFLKPQILRRDDQKDAHPYSDGRFGRAGRPGYGCGSKSSRAQQPAIATENETSRGRSDDTKGGCGNYRTAQSSHLRIRATDEGAASWVEEPQNDGIYDLIMIDRWIKQYMLDIWD
ncbi:hypothetical protein BD779DRAFT_971862 [Infundibulicybe gibba]|nr:hypothetical protein BD779DRAFT_971862 [Infundibulicybe gibba]